MNLSYKIEYELVAFLFTILLYIEMRLNYPIQNEKNKEFRHMTIIVILTEAFDLFSAITNGQASIVPEYVNVALNTLYFMSGLFLCYTFQHYIEVAVVGGEKESTLLKINKYILCCIELAVIINAKVGYFFYFSAEGTYERGILYLVPHLISLWLVLCASLALFVNRNRIEKKNLFSSVSFVLVYFIAVFFQTFVFPKVLIIMPAVSAMLVITIFSLESPDYLKLQDTLKELIKTKKQLEEANEKYYSLAYTDLMTGLRNRSAYNVRLEELKLLPNKEEIIFLMADVNNLKYLNDNLGHLIGDDAIEKAGRILKNNFDHNCQCYRIGGDEFAVIGYEVAEEIFAENYRHFMEEVKAEAEQSTYPFSIAVGYQRTGTRTIHDALKKADEKMYEDKARTKLEVKESILL